MSRIHCSYRPGYVCDVRCCSCWKICVIPGV